MIYVTVPTELPISEIMKNKACFSPGRYARFIPPTSTKLTNFAPLDKLILLRETKEKTKRNELYRFAEIGDIDVSSGGVTFHRMRGFYLPTNRPSIAKKGDILVSTVRTYRKGIGIVNDEGDDLVTTNALMNICGISDYAPQLTLLYLYSFLRTDFFVEQVWLMLNRGLYPRMDKGALDKILIPITSDLSVIRYVSALTQAIIDKEKLIRKRHNEIFTAMDTELTVCTRGGQFNYTYPAIKDIKATSRLDAGLYCESFRAFRHRIQDYKYGSTTLSSMGVKSRRGPNLAVSVIGKSLYSTEYKSKWYQLIRPVCITDYGTLTKMEYLGSKKTLPLVNQGEIVFGCEATWRSLVLCEAYDRCTTNFHGTILYWPGAAIEQVIWLRCVLDYMRQVDTLRYIAVGGQGGHLSPAYFDYIPIPKFPGDKRIEIARLYHNPIPTPKETPKLDSFVQWHRKWNVNLGIWELDREMKLLQKRLTVVQKHIIEGKTVKVPF